MERCGERTYTWRPLAPPIFFLLHFVPYSPLRMPTTYMQITPPRHAHSTQMRTSIFLQELCKLAHYSRPIKFVFQYCYQNCIGNRCKKNNIKIIFSVCFCKKNNHHAPNSRPAPNKGGLFSQHPNLFCHSSISFLTLFLRLTPLLYHLNTLMVLFCSLSHFCMF